MPSVPFKLNQDRRHHIPKQKHKVTNWREYDASLRQRGSLTVLCGRPERGNGFHRRSMRRPARRGGERRRRDCAGARFCSHEAPIGVVERSGQLRPYVRPVVRRSPLAIMGVRVRVRRQSERRARGTQLAPALPKPA